MYTLYHAPGAASLCVHWMLIELGVPFDAVMVDFAKRAQKSAEYMRLNPLGMVPMLVIDGAPHAETGALLMLLAERHPQAQLAPAPNDPERAAFLQWMFYLANQVQPAFRLWFYPEEAAGAHNVMSSQVESRKRIEAAWDRLDAQLSDGRAFLLGDRLSAADFLATMTMRWSRNMPRPATSWTHVGAYADRMRAMPSLIETHRREGLTDWITA